MPQPKRTIAEAPPDPPSITPLPLAANLDQIDFSQPWMRLWAEAAATTTGVVAACAAAGASLAEFNKARRDDPDFDDICRLLQQATDLRVAEKILEEALAGDPRAQAFYFQQLRGILRNELDDATKPEPLPAPVAAAMMKAGLAARAAMLEMRSDTAPPSPTS